MITRDNCIRTSNHMENKQADGKTERAQDDPETTVTMSTVRPNNCYFHIITLSFPRKQDSEKTFGVTKFLSRQFMRWWERTVSHQPIYCGPIILKKKAEFGPEFLLRDSSEFSGVLKLEVRM